MLRSGPLAVLALLCGCTPVSPAVFALSPQLKQQLTAESKHDSKPVLNTELPPGQRGPTSALLADGDLRLSTRRTEELFQDGNRRWKVELHRGTTLLASWDAASGIAEQQMADRRWSPGNAAPYPPVTIPWVNPNLGATISGLIFSRASTPPAARSASTAATPARAASACPVGWTLMPWQTGCGRVVCDG